MADVSSLSASIDSLVQQYRISLRKPVTTLENRKTTLNVRLKVLSEMKTKLNSFFNQVKDMSLAGSASSLISYTASSSNANLVSASASSADAVGTYSLFVSSLAQSDTLISAALESSSNSVVNTVGIGSHTFRVSINGVGNDVSVDLTGDETNSTVLTKISTAINAAGLKVKTSVISVTPTTNRLVFNSRDTGSSNAITLSETGEGLLSRIGLSESVLTTRTVSSGTAGGYLVGSTAGLDARFKLNGIDIVRSTNTINDAISGLIINLKGVHSSNETPATLTVGVDKDNLKQKIEKFIEEYNGVIKFIKAKTAVDSSSGARQILSGDSVFINLRLKLRMIIEGFVEGLEPNNPNFLSHIGITAAKDGSLSLNNSAALDDAIASNVSKVTDLFNSPNGIAVRMKGLIENFINSGGVVDKSSDGINSQIKSIDSRIKQTEAGINKKVIVFRTDLNKIQNVLTMVTQQQQLLQSIISGW